MFVFFCGIASSIVPRVSLIVPSCHRAVRYLLVGPKATWTALSFALVYSAACKISNAFVNLTKYHGTALKHRWIIMSASKEGNAADETDTWDADDFEVQDLGIASTHALGRQEGEVGRDTRDVISDKEKLASQKKEHGEVATHLEYRHVHLSAATTDKEALLDSEASSWMSSRAKPEELTRLGSTSRAAGGKGCLLEGHSQQAVLSLNTPVTCVIIALCRVEICGKLCALRLKVFFHACTISMWYNVLLCAL